MTQRARYEASVRFDARLFLLYADDAVYDITVP